MLPVSVEIEAPYPLKVIIGLEAYKGEDTPSPIKLFPVTFPSTSKFPPISISPSPVPGAMRWKSDFTQVIRLSAIILFIFFYLFKCPAIIARGARAKRLGRFVDFYKGVARICEGVLHVPVVVAERAIGVKFVQCDVVVVEPASSAGVD